MEVTLRDLFQIAQPVFDLLAACQELANSGAIGFELFRFSESAKRQLDVFVLDSEVLLSATVSNKDFVVVLRFDYISPKVLLATNVLPSEVLTSGFLLDEAVGLDGAFEIVFRQRLVASYFKDFAELTVGLDIKNMEANRRHGQRRLPH